MNRLVEFGIDKNNNLCQLTDNENASVGYIAEWKPKSDTLTIMYYCFEIGDNKHGPPTAEIVIRFNDDRIIFRDFSLQVSFINVSTEELIEYRYMYTNDNTLYIIYRLISLIALLNCFPSVNYLLELKEKEHNLQSIMKRVT